MKVVQDLMALFPAEVPVLSDTEYITRARQILREYVFRLPGIWEKSAIKPCQG
jgi:hypothetical protein